MGIIHLLWLHVRLCQYGIQLNHAPQNAVKATHSGQYRLNVIICMQITLLILTKIVDSDACVSEQSQIKKWLWFILKQNNCMGNATSVISSSASVSTAFSSFAVAASAF